MVQSTTNKMARNFSWLIIGATLSGLANFAAMVYSARVLQAAAFGLMNFALAFLAYLVLIVDSGLSLLGTREIARNKEQAGEIALNIFCLRLIIALCVLTLSIIVIFWLPLDRSLRTLLALTFLFVITRALNADWVFQGLEQMEYIALARVAYALLSLGFIVCLVKNAVDLNTIPLVRFISGLVVALAILYWLFRRVTPVALTSWQTQQWRDYFIQAIPLGASIVLIQIYNNLDTIMLGLMDTAAVVGYYNAAYQIFFVLVGFFALWQSTAIPVISQRIVVDKAQALQFMEKYARLTLMMVLPAAVVVCYASPLIILQIFGAAYQPAILALRVLIWTLIAIAFGSIYGVTVLIPAGKFNQFFWAVAAGAIVNIMMNFWLIPTYSFVGAALATILAEICAGSISMYFARKILNLNLLNKLLRFAGYSAMALLPVLLIDHLTRTLGLITSLSVGTTVFIVVYLLILALMEKEFIFSFVSEILSRRGAHG